VRSYQAFREARLQGSTTCQAELEACVNAIQDKAYLNAVIETWAEEAVKAAQESDARFDAGNPRPLEGMVITIKDVLAYAGHSVQASSHILSGYISPYHSTVVARLLEAGAILVGKVSCDEFAMGSSNETACYGPVKNPVDSTRVPGGSSGGSAAAVAAGMCHASIGSDTGGSVRQPAAFCGTVGLKPTYGRISRYGLIAYASSFDTVGVLSSTVGDSAAVLAAVAGSDPKDATSAQIQPDAYVETQVKHTGTPKKWRIAVQGNTLRHSGVQQEVKEAIQSRIEHLQQHGHLVEEVSLPLLDYLLPVYYILTTAEASSNLARFDGVRYGYRTAEDTNLDTLYKQSRAEGFGKEVKRRILLGTFVLSANYYDAYYTKAQRVRQLVRKHTLELLTQYDFLIGPTTPTTAFMLGESYSSPVEKYLADVFTVHASVAGMPAISLPVGSDRNGLPIGMQVVAGPFKEYDLLDFATSYLGTST
jgi:aspartyl-tRNA(Asn)/glutamyl-tRNA(Gln) amidotransferase subunit A